ncbi:MAG TPA: hypothetical protein VMJ74_05300 [Pseudomonadales bacterium]|nr:hypothetical protein [Pseudomonadales bacterium]
MARLKHPLSGAIYSLQGDGRVKVELNGSTGYFTAEGRWLEGDIKQADPHMSLWLAGPQLPPGLGSRRHRG